MNTITHRALFTLISDEDEPQVPVRMEWDPTNSLAVCFRFRCSCSKVGCDGFSEWTFALELLAKGLKSEQPVGIGDVEIGPDDDPWRVQIRLRSPDGRAVFSAPRGVLGHLVREAKAAERISPMKQVEAFLEEVFAA